MNFVRETYVIKQNDNYENEKNNFYCNIIITD